MSHQPALYFLLPYLILMTTSPAQSLQPPRAQKQPKQLETHAHCRVDEYYWMRERDNPELVAWLEAENAYREAVMSKTAALQQKLFNELRQRIKQDDQTAEYPVRGYLWFSRTQDGKQYAQHFRRRIVAVGQPAAAEQLVLDENVLAEGHEFCEVADLQVSSSGEVVAWPVDFVGRRMFEIQFRDMATGRLLADRIPDTTGNMVFAEDNQHLFYTRQDPDTLRFDKLFRHRLGTDPNQDQLIYFEEDEEFNLFLLPTKSRKYIQCVSMQTLSSEVRLIDAHQPLAEPLLFHPREAEHEYSLDHLGDRFVVLTNWQAPNNRLMQTQQLQGDKSDWQEILPHDPNVFVEDFELLDRWLVVSERFQGLTRFRYRPIPSTTQVENWQTIDFGEPCYSTLLAATSLHNTEQLRYSFSSFKTPLSIVDYNLATGQKTIVKQEQVLGGFDTNNYLTERLWATASDGTQIPISLVRHRATALDGTAPLLQYAYGAYGINMEDEFYPAIYNLLNRGFVYAIVHIRGGQELGRRWYDQGKLLHKRNSFTDFIDCTKHLVKLGYADPQRVYAQGGSAGGLLMGAVANMAPELYHGIIAEVPFVDVVTTMLDDTIPLTTSEYDEWGDPHQEQFYRYMLSYSPYDNVENKAYPNLLVMSGFHDSQVQYWEPAKWVARLRERKTDNNLLLLDMEMHAGHGGSSGRYDRYKEVAKMQAFVLMLAGLDD
jgi:oligopeptidase B